ncbi:MAG: mannose-1-phosphate guanylyltransferase [Blastocatellia bacterium]|jgi:NDP-sugar pyrophosphorylase family protein|nr:mannose-1-phosphate guanylyltransferase [Blastocatellia bacterium]
MRAMILAAGYGTRLWPLTVDRTKPAIPVLGRPLVGYVAEYLAGYGYTDVVVNLHHQPESVQNSLGDGSRFGVRLHYVFEPVILGTSGALDNARHLLEDGTFIVVNGKIITDINLDEALETHRRTNALATLVLQRNTARERFSIVETRDGLVTGFGGMPTPPSDNAGTIHRSAGEGHDDETHDDEAHDSDAHDADFHEVEARTVEARTVEARTSETSSGESRTVNEARLTIDDAPLMFTGIQILEPRIFDYIPRGVFSHSVTDVYLPAIAQGECIAAHVAGGTWRELSTIERYLEINLALLAAEGRDMLCGEGCAIAPSASVRQSILWDDVVVEAGASVSRSILADKVRVGAGEIIENAAVVRAELVRGEKPPPKALRGEFRGDNFVVPLPE